MKPGAEEMIEAGADGAILSIRAVPRASHTELVRGADGEIRLRIAAPPVDGAANAEIQRYFAKQLGIAKSRIELKSGATGRHKRILFREMTPHALAAALEEILT